MSGVTPKKEKSEARKAGITYSENVIIAQLQRSHGNVSHAASALGLTRSGLSNRIHNSEALQQVLLDARQTIVDTAENALMAAVVAKQGWAVCFALKTLGKDRGYVETQQLQQSGSVEVIVRREDRKGTTNKN